MTTKTKALRVPGAELHYRVRGSGPLAVLVGAPMGADVFEQLADLLATDHTVLTTDPRGIGGSRVDDPDADSTPEVRADDLARLITECGGPAVALGSSGGAVSVLALAQAHPEVVHTVIAHEPPMYWPLDDADKLRARAEEQIAAYAAGDRELAGRIFCEIAGLDLPEEVFRAIFTADRTPQQVSDDDFQHFHMLLPTVDWVPDIETLRAGAPRVVIGIGEESVGQHCERTSEALAAHLGIEPTRFPGDHVGFLGDPAGFADRLRSEGLV